MVPVKEPVAVPATRTELFDNVGDITGYENIQPAPEIYREIIDLALERSPDQKTFLKSL
jgi:hypothetical protein